MVSLRPPTKKGMTAPATSAAITIDPSRIASIGIPLWSSRAILYRPNSHASKILSGRPNL